MRLITPGGGEWTGMNSHEIKARYSAEAARQLSLDEECRFSLLPHKGRVLVASAWFEACSEAMLRGNYGPTEQWLRATASIASSQGYELDDLLRLMRICRRVAIEEAGWVEDQMEALDEVIDETLQLINPDVKWDIPEGLQYLNEGGPVEVAAEPEEEEEEEERGERRIHKRAYLKLPVRVRGWFDDVVDMVIEVTHTDNVARGGIRFETLKNYQQGQTLQIIYPYREDSPEVDQEMPAKVVRIDKRDYTDLVAVQFLVDLNTGQRLPDS